MAAYDYDSLVSVPAGVLTTFRTELTAAVALTSPPVSDSFTALANVALPISNRYLASAYNVWQVAERGNLTALKNAARAVLDQAVGIP